MSTVTSAKSGKARSRLPLVLLFLVFAGPMLGAWLVVSNQDWRPWGSVAHGSLVSPIRPLPPVALQRLGGGPLTLEDLRGQWTLLYIGPSNCGDVCQTNLYNMRQARLALGEDTHRVQRLMVLTDTGHTSDLARVLSEHEGLMVASADGGALKKFLQHFHVTDGDSPGRAQRIYTLDPLGNLVLFYEPDADPKGMLKDLERLLKASQVG